MELPFSEFVLMLTREPLDDAGEELRATDERCLAWFRAWHGSCEWPFIELRKRGGE